jgi:hypothetical protein
MRKLAGTLLGVIAIVGLIAVSADAQSLNRRHQIELRLGMWNQTTDARTEIGPGAVSTSVESDGFLGGIAYGRWLEEGLALTINVGGMAAQSETRTGLLETTTETDVVAPIILSMKYYLPKSTYGTSVRPFLKAGVGTFIGVQTIEETSLTVVTQSRTEMAIGGQLGAGVDFVVGRHFVTGLTIAYNVMNDFEEPIGGSRNYSGPEFVLGFSFVFGRGMN